MDRVLHFVWRLPLLRYSHCWLAVTVKKIRIRYVIQLLVIEVLLAGSS